MDAPEPVTVHKNPLVVDLDGTLIRSDMLVESAFALASAAPLRAARAALALTRGQAALKAAIAGHAQVDLDALPFNHALLDLLRAEKAAGRRIYLASASNEAFVHAIADKLALFDGVFASNAHTNLKGSAKAAALTAAFGPKGFDYAGNSTADLPVWDAAGGVIAVNASPSLQATVRRRFPTATIMPTPPVRPAEYLRALRVHQWLKNLLIFVPAFTSHHFDAPSAFACLVAFLSFSLCASSVYLLNDLLDLGNDRLHPTKRLRPFASGSVDLLHCIVMLGATLAASIVIALFLPWQFLLVLAVYYALTLSYSVYLKRQATLDVVTLACLYGIRLQAGAVAVDVILSPWLLTFSIFLFLCLALVKRITELIDRRDSAAGDPSGRGYRLADLSILQTMATASGYVAVLIFALYINSPAVAALYRAPQLMWVIPMILLYWISRIMILTHRGEMHDDPVLFAARDRTSLVCVVLMVLVVIASI